MATWAQAEMYVACSPPAGRRLGESRRWRSEQPGNGIGGTGKVMVRVSWEGRGGGWRGPCMVKGTAEMGIRNDAA